jgi:4-hydroxy-tetrahydrodipicolinate synthase
LKLTGSICALATPFRASDDALDLDAFRRLVGFQIRSGTRGLVVAGSTGEGAALDATEFTTLVEVARREIADRVPLLAGSGMQSTRKTIEQTRLAAAAGADIALVVTPAYVRPTQKGLYRHFSEVADKGGLPIMLYNVPSRTSCDLLPETVARLCAHPAIIGIKEARADEARMRDLLAGQCGVAVFSATIRRAPARSLVPPGGFRRVMSLRRHAGPVRACSRGDAEGATSRSAPARVFALLALEPNRFRSNGACSGLVSAQIICACAASAGAGIMPGRSASSVNPG